MKRDQHGNHRRLRRRSAALALAVLLAVSPLPGGEALASVGDEIIAVEETGQNTMGAAETPGDTGASAGAGETGSPASSETPDDTGSPAEGGSPAEADPSASTLETSEAGASAEAENIPGGTGSPASSETPGSAGISAPEGASPLQTQAEGTAQPQAETEAGGAQLEIGAPSGILMEASTGTVIYEKDADERRSPASVTKIMTMLLTFEAIDRGKIGLQDEVTTSAHAQSMGGSQVFLEEGEVQTVDTLLKCIAVASGNDASVAVAEYVAGSEEAFVAMMNQKAQNLGMTNTHFEDCCGLTDSDNHYTTARDIAVMSRELITRYPQVLSYTGIWMEDITHTTARGSQPFTLSSTNRLLKQYEWTTGLKTGSTSKARYCLSATARKDGMDLIAVVLAAPDNQSRFQDAVTLLNYGYAVSNFYVDANQEPLPAEPVEGGVGSAVRLQYAGAFRYLDVRDNDLTGVQKQIHLPGAVQAPVRKGEKAGEAAYFLNGKPIGTVDILFAEDVAKAVYKDYLRLVFRRFLL